MAAAALLWIAAAQGAWGQSSWPNYPNNNLVTVTSAGSVGIGTATPNALLGLYEGRYSLGYVDLVNPSVAAGAGVAFRLITPKSVNSDWTSADLVKYRDGRLVLTNWDLAGSLTVMTAGVERIKVTAGGNVGFGTANPQYKVTVEGAIGARDVIVTNQVWPDYVFRAGYRLRPLSEVSRFIEANGHLPDIPTEAEVKEKGVSLGDMQAKLLAKVEELTLHMIQQEKENRELRESLTKENRELRERLGRIEKGAPTGSPSVAVK